MELEKLEEDTSDRLKQNGSHSVHKQPDVVNGQGGGFGLPAQHYHGTECQQCIQQIMELESGQTGFRFS